MKMYDGHMHIGGYGKPEPTRLLNQMHDCGITGGTLISIDPSDKTFTYQQRMDNLFTWTKGYEDRLFPVAWLHPYEESVLDKVRDCAKRGVAAFKFIPDDYNVYDPEPTKVFRLIEELGYPIMFHCGILHDFKISSHYNRPINWECFINYKNLRFSLAHCGNPWYDEGLSLYRKFRWISRHMAAIAKGEPDIYTNDPWVRSHIRSTDSAKAYDAPQLFMDTTPGAVGLNRKEMLEKYCTSFPDGFNMFFGTDQYAEYYSPELVKNRLKEEQKILASVNASVEFLENMYCKNLFRFLFSKD